MNTPWRALSRTAQELPFQFMSQKKHCPFRGPPRLLWGEYMGWGGSEGGDGDQGQVTQARVVAWKWGEMTSRAILKVEVTALPLGGTVRGRKRGGRRLSGAPGHRTGRLVGPFSVMGVWGKAQPWRAELCSVQEALR